MRRSRATLLKTLNSTLTSSIGPISNASSVGVSSGLRQLSSVANHGGTGAGGGRFPRRDRRSYDDKDDSFGGNFDAHQAVSSPPEPIPGRPLRGDRRMPQSPREDVYRGNGYRSRGGIDREGDDFRRRSGGDRSSLMGRRRDGEGDNFDLGRRNVDRVSRNDRFHDMGDGGEMLGFGEEDEDDDDGKEKGAQPSIREFLRRSVKDEDKETKKEDREFLARFRLGGVDGKKKDRAEEKVEVHEEEKVEEPPQDADVIFKKMRETGLIPNAVAMLDGLCKDGLMQEAMNIFSLMREKGTMPEVIIYTAVVEGFCQVQKFDDAKRIFKKMQTNGIVPNAFSYGVLVRGLCKGKRLDEAVEVCGEMLEAGHAPNPATFTGLVHEFCIEKGAEEAGKTVEALKQKGYYLDEKAVRDYLDKKGPSSPMVWEAIFGPKKRIERPF